MPCSGTPRKRVFSLAQTDPWVAAYRRTSSTDDLSTKLNEALKGEKLKQARIDTEQKQLALREREGELIPRRSIELFASVLLTEMGDWSDQMPELIAGEVPVKYRKKVATRLRDELNSQRADVANELKRKLSELDADAA